jgi:threonine/homoserine/homoserine lactone efflux protein
MDLSTIISFTFMAALLVMTPGPNGVLVAKTVPTSGRIAAFANVAGFMSAFYFHGALSFFGISLILVQSAQLFLFVKLLGAAYLCWIGLRALYDAWRGEMVQMTIAPAPRPRTLAAAYVDGFLTNALNPKVSMFYLAAFPQFMALGQHSAASTFLLVFIHSVLNLIWFSILITLFSRASSLARSGRVQRWIKGATGTVFLGFGYKLAVFRP